MRTYCLILLTFVAIISCANGKTLSYHTSISFGSPKAPITIIELVAPTCHVCSGFSQTLVPKIIKHYVNKGKVHLVILPLTYNYVDLKASALILGAADPKEMYENVFKSQEEWLLKKDPLSALKTILVKKGISPQAMEKAENNKPLEAFLIQQRMDLEKLYDIDAIPMCIIGQKKIIGLTPWKDLKKHIDEALLFVKRGGRLESFGKKNDKQSKDKKKKNRQLKPRSKNKHSLCSH